MSVEMNKSASVRLTPQQEIRLAKPIADLYVGQILKTVVINTSGNDEMTININGQHLNAKTPYHFMPGDLLEIKVLNNSPEEVVLEVQRQDNHASILQSARLQYIPIQAPATSFLNHLCQLVNYQNLPREVLQQIRTMMISIMPLSQLPESMAQAIVQSGAFLESMLFELKKNNSILLKNDFKSLALKLLNSLSSLKQYQLNQYVNDSLNHVNQDHVPLPGAIPQPVSSGTILKLLDMTPEEIQIILKQQVTQVLARITSNQLHYLSHEHEPGYLIMLDLPVKTADGIDVIPIMIKEHKTLALQPAKWLVTFALHLSELGDLQAKIALTGQQLDVTINTKDSESINKLQPLQKEFNQLIANLGLSVKEWQFHHGLEENQIDVKNTRLLDIKI